MRIGARSARRRLRWAAFGYLLAGAVLSASAALPSSASAGPAKFTYEVCDPALPGGNTPGVKFAVNPGVAFVGANTCAQPGGSLSIAETGHASATFAYWDVPVGVTPGGYVEGMTISAQACGLGPGNDRTFVFEQGWPANCAGESQRIFHPAPVSYGLFGITLFLNCNGNYAPGCEAGPNVSARYIAATEVDPVAPKLSAPQGTLLAGGVLRGHHSISADATDVGGGLSKVTVTVDGLAAGQPNISNCSLAQVKNPSVIGTVAWSVTPCPASVRSSWTFDTAAYPFHDGANSVQVCASDFASLSEPNTSCSPAATVQVDNSCTESPVVGGEVLTAQFSRSHDEEITVPYAHPATVTGELANNAGDSVSGATICVQMQTQGSRQGLRPVATTTTDARGHFTYKVPPGPNRKVLVGYRHDTFQVARAVRYYAHAKPSLRLDPSVVPIGGQIRISGRVPGPRAGGRVVVLQASAPRSKRWFTFNRATANSHGVFRSRYRFDETTASTTYRIRVVVPRQAGYPFEVGHSKPALVEVRAGG